MPQTEKSVIPPGHDFLNPNVFISKPAKDIAVKLFEKADDRNPDLHDMYIYNDFYGYAILDLIDGTLSKIHTKVIKKQYEGAFHLLEGLTAFQCLEDTFLMCDDADRIAHTNKVYGAFLVATLRALSKIGGLDVTHYPSLETFLQSATEWGIRMETMGDVGSPYYTVCQGIGERLFEEKSKETIALEKARVEEYINTFDSEEQKDMREMVKEAEREKKRQAPWWKDGEEDFKDPDFSYTRVWKEYKSYLAGVPDGPLRGPPYWDISDWSESEKRAFSLDNQ